MNLNLATIWQRRLLILIEAGMVHISALWFFLNCVVRFALTSFFRTLSIAHKLSSLKISLFSLIKPQFFILKKASDIKEQNKLNCSQIHISSIKFNIQWNFAPFIYWFLDYPYSSQVVAVIVLRLVNMKYTKKLQWKKNSMFIFFSTLFHLLYFDTHYRWYKIFIISWIFKYGHKIVGF